MDAQLTSPQPFLDRLNNVLENNYHDESFGVSELAKQVAISRSQLHRKLKAQKGITASQFIMVFRLHKAYELLISSESTVSEVAYAVGFGSPSYFTRCFQQHYNFSPIELKQKSKKEIHNTFEQPINRDRWSKWNWFQNNQIISNYLHLGQYRVRNFSILILILLAMIVGVAYNFYGNSTEQRMSSIAILPIEVESTTLDEAILSQGIQQGLSSSLGRINGLNVLAGLTTSKYKDSKKTKDKILQELKVDFLVSGRVKYSDKDSIIMNLTLYKLGASDYGVQTLNYSTSIENILNIQNEAANGIGLSTGLLKSSEHSQLLANGRKVNKDAYKNYIRGMYYLHKSSQKDFDKGIQFLYKALDDDPAEPLIYAGLAYGHVILGHSAAENSNVFGIAKMAAKQAIQLDPSLLEAYASLASIAIYHDRNWKEAEELFKYVLSKNPSMANVHYDYAWYLFLIGEKEEALYHQEMAERLDPLNTKYMGWTGWMNAYYGNYDQAMDKVETIWRIVPEHSLALLTKGLTFKLQNNLENALDSYKRLYEKSPKHAASFGGLCAEMGEFEKANEIIEEVKNWPKSPWKNWTLAYLYASLNNVDEAIMMLNTEPKHAYVAWVNVMPGFDRIKHHEKFKSFVSSLNIPNSKTNF
ncbi:helix-turn-helix domain-containing protein [Geojedonia litorea]|uniref:Helix-turn-helix domain-containing protein n=1 Tax=Geojedonia litorea TaxID=1268269 RepID=A0ABV9N4H6_9FLAO